MAPCSQPNPLQWVVLFGGTRVTHQWSSSVAHFFICCKCTIVVAKCLAMVNLRWTTSARWGVITCLAKRCSSVLRSAAGTGQHAGGAIWKTMVCELETTAEWTILFPLCLLFGRKKQTLCAFSSRECSTKHPPKQWELKWKICTAFARERGKGFNLN